MLDHALELKSDIGELDVVGFGAQRIRFAIELLRQKIEPAANRPAATEQFEDLVAAGVIDPAKVTRTALQNASSIAGLMLTTEAMISELPEEKGDGGMGGMGGGMGGMGMGM